MGEELLMKRNPNELVKNSFDWKLRILETGSKPHSVVDGKKVIMFCSNNYLNLSNHPKIIQASIDAAKNMVQDLDLYVLLQEQWNYIWK